MSFVQVRAKSSGSAALAATERTPFYGARLPDEIKRLLKLAKKLEMGTFKNILKLVIQSVEEGELEEGSFQELCTDQISEEILRTVFAGVRVLVMAALRQPGLKQDIFKEDLAQINFPVEMIAVLASAVFKSRKARLDQAILDKQVRLPQVKSLRWRVDVAISTSSLNRVLEPYVTMEITLSTGEIKTFEVSVSKFHELRYNVTYVLKEMEDLEKRNILKIGD